MTPADHHDFAKLTVLGAGALLVGDLFMAWQRTAVHVSAVVDVHTSGTGWSGWGIVAGALALVVIGMVGAQPERPLALLLVTAACWPRRRSRSSPPAPTFGS